MSNAYGVGQGMLTRARANSQPNTTPFLSIDFEKRREKIGSAILQKEEIKTGMEPNTSNVIDPLKEGEEISPQKWLSLFNTLNNTLGSLQAEIRDLKSLKGKVEHFSTEWKDSVDVGISSLEAKTESQDFKIKLLTNVVIAQEEKIAL